NQQLPPTNVHNRTKHQHQ
ncbi:hypothetical protein CP03DC35_1129B, partial [Chlamydia psittaci 03DC35]